MSLIFLLFFFFVEILFGIVEFDDVCFLIFVCEV